MKMFKIFCFIVTAISIENCEPARILGMFPAPVLSHQIVFKALMQELAKRGHQVTVVTSFSVKNDEKLDNYTEIDLTQIGKTGRNMLLKNQLNKIVDMHDQFEMTMKLAFNFVNMILETREIQDLIKYNKFDLILVEDCTKSVLIVSHLFKAPVILISSFGGSFGTFETVGGVVHPLLYPLATRKRFRNLSNWDKISEIFAEYRLQKIHNELIMAQNEMNKKKYGANTPTIDELKENVQMVFLNIHSIWDSNRPVPPNVIHLGGLHRKSQKELPKDLKSSLDSSVSGAIYVSFGTTVDLSIFTENILRKFINVFSKLPYDVYMKWDDEKLPGLSGNVKISKWFPQSDLLRHPNVKLFITQGGLQSTDEAIAAGVPLIGLPILWDQWFNVDKYIQLKIGIQLDLETLTEDELKNGIETVLNDREYYNNIVKLRSIMLDSPQSSLERAVWWTEYVLRHGAVHLRTPAVNMSWIDYYEIKTVLYLLAILIIVISIAVIILKHVLKFIFNKHILNKAKIH